MSTVLVVQEKSSEENEKTVRHQRGQQVQAYRLIRRLEALRVEVTVKPAALDEETLSLRGRRFLF